MFQVRWWWYDLDEDRPPPSPFLLLIKMYTFHTEHVDTLVVAILVVYRIYCVFIQHDNEDGKPGSLPVWTRDIFSHSLLNPWRTVLYDLFFTLKLEFNILRSSSSLSFIWNPTSSTRWLFEEGLGLLVGPLVTGEWFYFTLCTKGSSFFSRSPSRLVLAMVPDGGDKQDDHKGMLDYYKRTHIVHYIRWWWNSCCWCFSSTQHTGEMKHLG